MSSAKATYGLRQKVVEHGDLKKLILDMIDEKLGEDLDDFLPGDDDPANRNAVPSAIGPTAAASPSRWRSGRRAISPRWSNSSGRAGPRSGPKEGLKGVAAECVTAALDLYADPETSFFRWNLVSVARWARRLGLAAEANEMAQSLLERVLGFVDPGRGGDLRRLRERGGLAGAGGAGRRELPLRRRAVEEWDLKGLSEWAQAAGISLPVAQWQMQEEEDVEVDRFNALLDTVRKAIHERLERELRRGKPVDLMKRVCRHEATRRVACWPTKRKAACAAILGWMEKALSVTTPAREVMEAIEAEREAVRNSLASQLAEKLSGRSEDEAGAFCAEVMVKTFLDLDLAAPRRNLAAFCMLMQRKYGVTPDPFELSSSP